jgi:acyl-CoA synthetase (NDP forming)
MNNIEDFLAASSFAVAGASQDRAKYGNKVFRALVASGRTVYPLNPTAPEVEGHPLDRILAKHVVESGLD